MNYQAQGLYKVVDGVYQLRGNEISNITIFRTKTGYVLNDVGLVDGTMRDAWEFAKKHLPEPHTIHAVVYSHPHGDHFGGVRGLSEDFADDVKMIAPEGFVDALSAENMVAGNAMARRADYQYGTNLPKNANGQVDNAIGLAHGVDGIVSLVSPNTQHPGQSRSTHYRWCRLRIHQCSRSGSSGRDHYLGRTVQDPVYGRADVPRHAQYLHFPRSQDSRCLEMDEVPDGNEAGLRRSHRSPDIVSLRSGMGHSKKSMST